MASVKLLHIKKKYDNTVVIHDFTVSINDGEFVSFLGPSGCGKTTSLRMIAGFDEPTSGEIFIGDIKVSSPESKVFVPPEKRNIGMVFQNYAVWPHMNVFDNVAYPLKIKKANNISDKVKRALEMVKMEGMEGRYPHQLSGGQQQRVALARALVMEPRVLLLDEPLSNLDAKLREDMRFEIKDIQRRLGITIIYVTHDQAEAMAMSDFIVVMERGEIRQIGTSMEIYKSPKDKFVADFIGLTNFLEAKKVKGGFILIDDDRDVVLKMDTPNIKSDRFIVSVRPEKIRMNKDDNEDYVRGKISRKVYLGDRFDYRVNIGDKDVRVQTSTDIDYSVGEEVSLIFDEVIYFDK